jgi:hypothetical protein
MEHEKDDVIRFSKSDFCWWLNELACGDAKRKENGTKDRIVHFAVNERTCRDVGACGKAPEDIRP